MYLNTHSSTYFDAQLFSLRIEDEFTPSNYQFLMVLNGAISVESADQKLDLKSEDFIMMLPFQKYQVIPSSENYLLSIEISRSFILSKIDFEMNLICNSFVSEAGSDRIRSVLTNLMMTFHADSSVNQKIPSLYANLFLLVKHLRTYYMFNSTAPSDIQDQRYDQRKTEILNYLYCNYQLSITMQNLADSLFLSPQYLAKFIKQHFGQTFYKLLTGIRLENALVELTQTEHSLTTIAFKNGFPNLNAFNKSFKEFFDSTPSAYRQNDLSRRDVQQQKKLSAITPANYQAVKEFAEKEEYAIGEQDQPTVLHSSRIIRTDVEAVPLNKIWCELINLGSAKNVLFESTKAMFQASQKDLHFKYARIENIFDDDIIYKVPSTDNFNFKSLDTILDFLSENNTLPHLELGVKPDKLSIFTSANGSFLQEYSYEKNEAYYLEALEALLIHAINRYGISHVSSWRFELWARHEDALEYKESPDKYVKRFKAFRDLLDRYLPSAVLGGPGFNTTSSSTFFIHLMQEFEKKKIYPDFISLYLFSYEMNQISPSVILTPSQDRYARVLRAYRQNIDSNLSKDIPIIVTEYNSDITTNNYTIYSCFQSSFICKNNVDLLDQVTGLGYYVFANPHGTYMTEHRNSDLGLIGIHSIKNPSYFAYELLNRLGSRIISKSEHCIVTADSSDRYQILAFNYAHFNPTHCINFFEQIDIEHTYDIYEQIAPITLDYVLTPVKEGRYKIVTHILNRQHGSVLDQYIQQLQEGTISSSDLLNIVVNQQVDEIEYYKNICVPKQLFSYVECKTELPIQLTLEPHQITFMEISEYAGSTELLY